MIGRVTSALTNSNLVFSMQNSYSNYAKLTTQLSSGKKINSMLDDPTQSVNLVNSKRELTRIDTWNNNIKSLKNEIGQATDTLDLLIESGQRAKDLATSVSNNIYNEGSYLLKTASFVLLFFESLNFSRHFCGLSTSYSYRFIRIYSLVTH